MTDLDGYERAHNDAIKREQVLMLKEGTMHQAIVTKFFGPSRSLGARVLATSQAGSTRWHWDHALNPDANHVAAARAHAEQMKWDGVWIAAGLPDSNRVFVWVPPSPENSNYLGFEVLKKEVEDDVSGPGN